MSFLNTEHNKCGLVIGINYENDDNAKLNGCINDTSNICNFLKSRCGYSDSNIQLLTDNTNVKPTRQNIINAIQVLVQKVKDIDSKEVWFSYSGHGSYLHTSNSSEETDSQDEALVPLDYRTQGLIRDDTLYQILVKALPDDCNLFCIIDACHSGTALDLPYLYRIDTGVTQQREPENIANIVKLSGCRDSQTSADAYIQGKYQGALTFAFLKCMDDLDYNFTPKHLVQRCKHYLNSNNYPQIPTMTFSQPDFIDKQIMGEGESVDYNINLYLEGDSWCNQESSWNILSIQENKLLFASDRRFYARNEKINYQLNLPDGKYILILKDSYGDGGISGRISNSTNYKTVKNFNFSNGTYQSIEFEVSQEILNTSKRELNIEIRGDYYSRSESSWNIRDSLGNYIYHENQKFTETNEIQKVNLKLEPGTYYFKCMDSYGDGGINGLVKDKLNKKVLLKFKWANQNWKGNEGYEQYFKFKVPPC